MLFRIGESTPDLKILLAEDEWPGVVRIAGKVADDICRITGVRPEVAPLDGDEALEPGNILVGTLGHSSLISKLEEAGLSDVSEIKGKREVYSFRVSESDGGPGLVIAGSDKRGTIYGLLHLSEIAGISPWVWFADVEPSKSSDIWLTDEHNCVSHEPSVEYRGIFINDEWPSFGNWTMEHFGGFTTEMYDHVFELILRLKGNYLWPAMWTSSFSLDGPGLSSAELADEYGIVMSNSHHEPCLRHSEEWDLVKGEDTPYGTAWNFDRNRDGLINYWRDGLKRNGRFENIITMGMRGERDSEVLGAEATLKDNIDYIKEVVKVQNDLIRENVNEDLSKVPRMIAIYKEVEQYYNGDESAEGLRLWDGLDGITCMLCEDNHGNMRGLPSEEERDRDGGFGMYYHFDYHGGPISYEWINSTTLAKTHEQMCEAYEAGVRKIWIVNTGDLKPQELPISFFMDLAYDYDRWGLSNRESTVEYLHKWVQCQFGTMNGAAEFDPEAILEEPEVSVTDVIEELIDGYTYINLCRKPEALNERIYAPYAYGESAYMLRLAADLYNKAAYLAGTVFEGTPLYDAYEELVGFPVRATCNLLYMQICAGRNRYLAGSGRPSANIYTTYINECMLRDEALTDLYHSLAGGKWNHMMSSEHIGFNNWNDELATYPVMCSLYPSRRPRMIVSVDNEEQWDGGGDWTRRPMYVADFLDPEKDTVTLTIENAGTDGFEWKASADRDWISLSDNTGYVDMYAAREADPELDVLNPDPESLICNIDKLQIYIERDRLDIAEGEVDEACVTIETGFSKVYVILPATKVSVDPHVHYLPMVPADYLESKKKQSIPFGLHTNTLGLIMAADDYDDICQVCGGEYLILSPYGKYRTAIKAYPVTKRFDEKNAPTVSYEIYVPEETDLDITIITAPSNPIDGSSHLELGLSMDDGSMQTVSMVGPDYMGGENSCPEWCISALDQEHTKTVTMHTGQGIRCLKLWALDPGVVPERIMIRPSGTSWACGYLIPAEDLNIPNIF